MFYTFREPQFVSHLALCVCVFFLGGKGKGGGEHPICTDTRRVIKI